MSLTAGTGPLAGSPGGEFNFDFGRAPAHRIFYADYAPRLRAVLGGAVVLDTENAKLLHETGILLFETGMPARVYIPRADIAAGVLTRAERRTECPYKGQATYWSLPGIENAAWSYEAPLPEAIKIQGHVAFDAEGVAVELGRPRAALPIPSS